MKNDEDIDKSVVDRINDIFLNDTREYSEIKEIAEKDLGKEILSRIDKFLDDRKKQREIPESTKVFFEDPSKVRDKDINDIMDTFIKLKSADAMDEIDEKSIDDILLLINQWASIKTNRNLAGMVDEEPEKLRQDQPILEEHIAIIENAMPIGNLYRNPLELTQPELPEAYNVKFQDVYLKPENIQLLTGDNHPEPEHKEPYKVNRI